MTIFVLYVPGAHIRQIFKARDVADHDPFYQLDIVVPLSSIVEVRWDTLSIFHLHHSMGWWYRTKLISRHPVLCAHCCDIMTINILMSLCHPVHFLSVVQIVENKLSASVWWVHLRALRLFCTIDTPVIAHVLPLVDNSITNAFLVVFTKLIKFFVKICVACG